MISFFLILFLLVNEAGNMHACLPDDILDPDEYKKAGQVKRLINLFETLANDKIKENISSVNSVHFYSKKSKVPDTFVVRGGCIPHGDPCVEEQSKFTNKVFVFDYTESDASCNDYFSIWYESFKNFLKNSLCHL